MDFALAEEQELLVRSLRAFCERELYPHEADIERLGHTPTELAAEIRRKARASGFYALNMPAAIGGGGLDVVTLTLADRELGRPSTGLSAHVGRPSYSLLACRGDQVETYLKPTVEGERVQCTAITEPEAGSDARAMRTRAVPDGDDYVINGVKQFISNADHADFIVLFAVTGENEVKGRKRSGSRAFSSTRICPA